MHITRRHLLLIHHLMDTHSIADTAARLHVSASALSHQLRELETQVGGTVVHRKQKPFHLSETGQKLLDCAAGVLPQFDKLEHDLRRLEQGEVGRLHLAIECHSCYKWLMPTLDQYRDDWPDIELDLASGFYFDALQRLLHGEIDLVVSADPVPDPQITYVPLFRYESVLAVSRRHALAAKDFVRAEDLSDETLIIYPVAQSKLDVFRLFLQPAGIQPKALRSVELTVMMMQLVASGRGVCALPNWAADEYADKGYIRILKLGKKGVFNTLYAAVRQADLEREYLRDFILLAKDLPFAHLRGIAKPSPHVP